MKEHPQEKCTNCDKKDTSWCVCKVCRNNSEQIAKLTKIYSKVVAIVDDWALMAHIHGDRPSKTDEKILKQYVKILKKIGVIKK